MSDMSMPWAVLLSAVAAAAGAVADGAVETRRVASPDRSLVAFVKATPASLVETGAGAEEATELWTSHADGTGARMWLRGHRGRTTEETLASFSALQFSPDGRRIYFLSAAWATSAAVHVLDLRTGKESYVGPGNSLEVIQTGRYAGDLIVCQHRYFLAGGSYDWLWLLTPDGHEVGAIADDGQTAAEREKAFRELYVQAPQNEIPANQ